MLGCGGKKIATQLGPRAHRRIQAPKGLVDALLKNNHTLPEGATEELALAPSYMPDWDNEMEDAPMTQRTRHNPTPGKTHDLVILSWNSDRHLGQTLADQHATSMLGYADEIQADIICLQETISIAPDGCSKYMQKGWHMLRHDEKNVAMLIRVTTGEALREPTSTWFSRDHHTMSATFATPDGPLIIFSAYCKSGMDDIPYGQLREEAQEQHAEILTRCTNEDETGTHKYIHAFVAMDANETMSPTERVLYRATETQTMKALCAALFFTTYIQL